jgi:fatty acid desaturase
MYQDLHESKFFPVGRSEVAVHLAMLSAALIVSLMFLALYGPWVAMPILIVGTVASCVWRRGNADGSGPDRTAPQGERFHG